MLEPELAHDEASPLRGVVVLEGLEQLQAVADSCHSYLTHLETLERFRQRNHRLQTEQPQVSMLLHGQRVINRHQDLIVPLRGERSPQPDLIIAIMRGNERYDLLHVKSFTGLEIALQVLRQLRLEHDAQLFAQRG